MKNYIKFLFFILVIILTGLIFFYNVYYKKKFINNIAVESLLYIPTGSNYEEVKKRIKNKLINYEYFILVGKSFIKMNNIKPGKYRLNVGDSNQKIINKLINGEQEPVILNIYSLDHISQYAEIIRKNFEANSLMINSAIKKQAYQDGFLDIDAIKIYFIPNKYIFFWTDSPEKIIGSFKRKYEYFWNLNRKIKAKKLNLTPFQVINFASLTQKESNKKEEQSRIAGLYLNRFRLKMKLQCDCTILFAKKKKQGFKKNFYRVYNNDLDIKSPYNTYKNFGLPPLPICSPNPSAIDAVLNAEKHDFIFMCASSEKIGYHLFSKDYNQHENNAKAYWKYLNKKNIK